MSILHCQNIWIVYATCRRNVGTCCKILKKIQGVLCFNSVLINGWNGVSTGLGLGSVLASALRLCRRGIRTIRLDMSTTTAVIALQRGTSLSMRWLRLAFVPCLWGVPLPPPMPLSETLHSRINTWARSSPVMLIGNPAPLQLPVVDSVTLHNLSYSLCLSAIVDGERSKQNRSLTAHKRFNSQAL